MNTQHQVRNIDASFCVVQVRDIEGGRVIPGMCGPDRAVPGRELVVQNAPDVFAFLVEDGSGGRAEEVVAIPFDPTARGGSTVVHDYLASQNDVDLSRRRLDTTKQSRRQEGAGKNSGKRHNSSWTTSGIAQIRIA